ncbi:hypothetical protein D3C86_1523760 [compost metagenome]
MNLHPKARLLSPWKTKIQGGKFRDVFYPDKAITVAIGTGTFDTNFGNITKEHQIKLGFSLSRIGDIEGELGVTE